MSALVQALLLDVGGTLSFTTIDGTPSSASVSLFDTNGTLLVTGTPTITGTGSTAVLSYVVAAGYVDETGDNYRAPWSYTADGVARVRQQTWCVKARIAYHQLTSARLASPEYYPILASRTAPGTSTHDTAIAAAFAEYQAWVRAKGLDPHRVMDTAPVEPIIAALAAHRIALSYGFGSATTNDWQAWAEARLVDAQRLFDKLLQSVGWYDADESLDPDDSETGANLGVLRITR